jgi:hypothetical protein
VKSLELKKVSQEKWFTEDNLLTWIKAINVYLRRTIKHPEKQDKRLGANEAFLLGTGDCDEFTDLFITLARIRGIPCRRLTGYFIRNQKEQVEPHAWVEILSSTLGWIPIDIALQNIGKHTIHYIINKIEEFNPALSDYQLLKPSTSIHYHWEIPLPSITPMY